MFQFVHHPSTGLMVLLLRKPDDADWEQCIQAIQELDRNGVARRMGTLCLATVEVATRPNATLRRRIAEMRSSLQAPRRLVAAITRSPILRGVMTTLNWILPAPAEEEITFHESFEAAVYWGEERRGQKLPLLYEMQRELFSGTSPPRS